MATLLFVRIPKDHIDAVVGLVSFGRTTHVSVSADYMFFSLAN